MKLCIKHFAIYERQVSPIPVFQYIPVFNTPCTTPAQTLSAWLAHSHHSRSFRIHITLRLVSTSLSRFFGTSISTWRRSHDVPRCPTMSQWKEIRRGLGASTGDLADLAQRPKASPGDHSSCDCLTAWCHFVGVPHHFTHLHTSSSEE